VPRVNEWFVQTWEFARSALPPVPATVIEIGCGSSGGLVPRLRSAGYDATGIDPNAPDEPGYTRVEFEQSAVGRADAIVACTSLHHVADLDFTLDRVASSLVPGGALIVVEMAWERYDEQTARWCFGQVPDDSESWLRHQRDEFAESDLSWDAYRDAWAGEAGLHTGGAVLAGLGARFDQISCEYGPYFFGDLAAVSRSDEQAAIEAGQIAAVGIRYLARAR
jgi:SAM-dependent methyltransferase